MYSFLLWKPGFSSLVSECKIIGYDIDSVCYFMLFSVSHPCITGFTKLFHHFERIRAFFILPSGILIK